MHSPSPKVIRNKKGFIEDRGIYTDYLTIKAVAESPIHISMGVKYIYLGIEEEKKIKKSNNIEVFKTANVETFDNMLPFDGVNYIIPGTSIKGAIRFRAEMMFKSVNNLVPSCYVVYNHIGRPSQTYMKIWGEQVLEFRKSCRIDAKAGLYNLCEICDIFGAPGAIAKISFTNLVPKESDFAPQYMDIDGKIVPVFPEKTEFEGKIYYNSRQLELYQLGLILRAMRIPEKKPILIGRYKYKMLNRGKKFGLLKLEIIESSNKEFSVNEAVKAFDESELGKKYYRKDLDETAILSGR